MTQKEEIIATMATLLGRCHSPELKKQPSSFLISDLVKIADEYAEAYLAMNDTEVFPQDVFWHKIRRDRRFLPEIIVTMECSRCGDEFEVRYLRDGTYEYLRTPCECEADFHPLNGEPSISEWLASLF